MESDSTSYVKLKQLADSVSDPSAQVVQRLVAELRNLSAEGLLELRLSGAAPIGTETYRIRITPTDACLLDDDDEQDPTLVVSMPGEAFYDIASGALSPQQAYLERTLTLRGNVELSRAVMRHLRVSGTAQTVCPILLDPIYSPVVDGGALTLAGQLFTPSGTVALAYDYGGGAFAREVTADAVGAFRVTQAGLPCGEILGLLGIGVVVEAFDRESGQATVQNFATSA